MPVPDLALQDAWSRIGLTRHWGGVDATDELLDALDVVAGDRVLDLGCGTGYTSCLLAARGARVVAADLNPDLLAVARGRARREGVGLDLVRLDGHRLPLRSGVFDAVVAESVLVFCDRRRVADEVHRVLHPGGVYGGNEATALDAPPPDLVAGFEALLGFDVRAATPGDWIRVFSSVGFEDVHATTHRLRSWQEVRSHLKVNGVWPMLASLRHLGPLLRETRLPEGVSTRRMVRETRRVMGYGLYVARKPD